MITVKHGVFHLQNEKNSYLFRVRDGFLEHLHFGARVSASDADALAVQPGCGWGDSTLYREDSNANCMDIFLSNGAAAGVETTGKARWSCCKTVHRSLQISAIPAVRR